MQDRTIEIKELFELFKKKIWIIIVITAIFAVIGYQSASQLTTSYQARVKVYIGDSSNVMTGYMSDNVYYYNDFIESFKEIIMIEDFLNETLEKYDLGLTAGQVSGALSFTHKEEYSPILEINYRSWSQELAGEVLDVLAKEFAQQAQKIMPDVQVQVIDSVKVYPIVPNKTAPIRNGILIGIVLSVGLILVLDYLDDTIRKKEELEKILSIPVLGELPHTKETKGA